MSKLPPFLVFQHHLAKSVLSLPKDQRVILIESPWIFINSPATKAELVTYRAGLQALRERLLVKGYQVDYLDAATYPKISKLTKALASLGITECQSLPFAKLHDEQRLERAFTTQGLTLTIVYGTTFLTQKDWLAEMGGVEKSEQRFSTWLRRKAAILVDKDGNPEGGSWKLPQAPKRKYSLEVPLPERNRYVEEAAVYVQKHFPRQKGGVSGVPSPVTFADAEDQMHYVFEGDWQASPEKICQQYIMPSIELGLLTPMQVITTLDKNRGTLAAKEAFIRPILRREYTWVRGGI